MLLAILATVQSTLRSASAGGDASCHARPSRIPKWLYVGSLHTPRGSCNPSAQRRPRGRATNHCSTKATAAAGPDTIITHQPDHSYRRHGRVAARYHRQAYFIDTLEYKRYLDQRAINGCLSAFYNRFIVGRLTC